MAITQLNRPGTEERPRCHPRAADRLDEEHRLRVGPVQEARRAWVWADGRRLPSVERPLQAPGDFAPDVGRWNCLATRAQPGASLSGPAGRSEKKPAEAGRVSHAHQQGYKDSKADPAYARNFQHIIESPDFGKLGAKEDDVLDQARDLLSSPEFLELDQGTQRVASDGLVQAKGDPTSVENMRSVIRDPAFQALDPAEQRHTLIGINGLNSSLEFLALPAADQKLALDGIIGSRGDLLYSGTVKGLVGDAKFQALGAAEKTAVLSQVKNYPDARSVYNVQRLTQKDWFTDFSFEDKQRSLKTIAFLSQHNGDRTIIDNTLDKFLAPGAPYKFDWNEPDSYGSASGNTFSFNRDDLPADNGKVDISNVHTYHMTTHTVAHEVNHLVNNYPYPARLGEQ